MKIVFVSNYLNGHQTEFCQYMYQEKNVEFVFLQTEHMEEERINLGWKLDSINYPYLIDYGNISKNVRNKLFEMADVIILGDSQIDILSYSLKRNVLILFYRERLFKKKQQLFLLRKLKLWYRYVFKFRKFQTAVLCASAYASADFNEINAFSGRRFKWGYFPQFIDYKIEELLQRKQKNSPVKLLWVGRLIKWKRCIDVLEVAKRLREDDISFHLDIVGTGILEEELREYVNKCGLNGHVEFKGSCPQKKVRFYMEQANIFVLSSTHEEGWGAVVNEAMNSGCVVIGSHAAGSVPFLIEHEKNGLIYKSMDVDDLYFCIQRCLNDPTFVMQMGYNAYLTIKTIWNAENATEQLLYLINCLIKQSKEGSIENGPCSDAHVLADYWFKGER